MPGGNESELKFSFPPHALGRVRIALEKEAERAPERRRLISSYFDTQDDYLWRHGATLRLRDDGARRMQTLKRTRASVLDRDEYEFETKGEGPELGAFERTPLARFVEKPKLRDGLHANIRVDVRRDVSLIAEEGSKIEAALDDGEIRVQGVALCFSELELELKEGQRDALFDVARRLCKDAPISLSLISKAERGHLLANGVWGNSFKGDPPAIKREMTCGETFRLICHACLHDFDLNMLALTGSDAVEAVHQGRVALRRLRAAFQLFKPVVNDADYRRLDDELKWISHVFGAGRDLDVFQGEAFEPAARDGNIPGARKLADFTGAERDEAHKDINAAVSSSRFRGLLLDLIVWIEGGAWTHENQAGADAKVGAFGRRRLKKALRKFIKRSRDFPDREPDQQHKVRIRAKKLRYMAGFFKEAPELVSRPKALKRLLGRLEKIQDSLGKIHDQQAKAAFLVEEIRRLPVGTDPVVGFAAGRLAEPAGHIEKMRAKAWRAFCALAKAEPF